MLGEDFSIPVLDAQDTCIACMASPRHVMTLKKGSGMAKTAFGIGNQRVVPEVAARVSSLGVGRGSGVE
jgi:hypothetical protein